MRVHHLVLLGVVLRASAVTLCSSIAIADPPPAYFPLEIGARWDFSGSEGNPCSAANVGYQQVIGVATVVHFETYPSIPDTVLNFWTIGADGDVLLHGAHAITVGLIASYDPPILYLDAPLYVGKRWSSTTQPYRDLEGHETMGPPFTIQFGVYSSDTLDLPAGRLFAYEVGQVVPMQASGLSGRTLTGTLVQGGAGSLLDWFSSGTGEVQFHAVETYRLVSYQPGPTAVAPFTWGRLKALTSSSRLR